MAESPSDARFTETLLRILHGVLGPLPDGRAIAADDASRPGRDVVPAHAHRRRGWSKRSTSSFPTLRSP